MSAHESEILTSRHTAELSVFGNAARAPSASTKTLSTLVKRDVTGKLRNCSYSELCEILRSIGFPIGEPISTDPKYERYVRDEALAMIATPDGKERVKRRANTLVEEFAQRDVASPTGQSQLASAISNLMADAICQQQDDLINKLCIQAVRTELPER